MKICLLVDPLDEQSAGVHTYTKELTKHLLELDQENEYVLIHSAPNVEIRWWIDQRNAKTQAKTSELIIPNRRRIPGWASLRKFAWLPWTFRKLQPDLIFEPAHIGPFSWFWPAKKVVTIHDLTPVLFPEHHVWISRVVHKLLLPKIIEQADQVVVPSAATQQDVERLYQPRAIRVIAEAADKSFQPSRDAKVLKRYGIKQPYLLSVGTLEPRKQLDLLVQAFAELDRSDLQLVLVGQKGWYVDELLKLVEESSVRDRIVVTGYAPKEYLPALYSQAELMVYPSLYEGFGLPVLEAMQCGCPVICSNSSSLPEVVGEAGMLVPPGDKDALLQIIKHVLSDGSLRERMSQRGLKQAEQFSWQRAAQETLETFMKLA